MATHDFVTDSWAHSINAAPAGAGVRAAVVLYSPSRGRERRAEGTQIGCGTARPGTGRGAGHGINMPPTKHAARREKTARRPSSIYGPAGELVQTAAGDLDISGAAEVAFSNHAQ